MQYYLYVLKSHYAIRREEDVDDSEDQHGHVTSISVLRSYRRLGLAKKLMVQSRAFHECCGLAVEVLNLGSVPQKKQW